MSKGERKRVSRTVLVVIALVLVCIGLQLITVYSDTLNQRIESIDITCGRKRIVRYRYFMCVEDKVVETRLSQLYRELIGEPSEPVWKTVYSFKGNSRISPHYLYHGAFHVLKNVTDSFDLVSFTPDAKKNVIRTVFKKMQEEGNDHGAEKYSLKIFDIAIQTYEDGGEQVNLCDLPNG